MRQQELLSTVIRELNNYSYDMFVPLQANMTIAFCKANEFYFCKMTEAMWTISVRTPYITIPEDQEFFAFPFILAVDVKYSQLWIIPTEKIREYRKKIRLNSKWDHLKIGLQSDLSNSVEITSETIQAFKDKSIQIQNQTKMIHLDDVNSYENL